LLILQFGISLGLLILTKGWVMPLGLVMSLALLCLYRRQARPFKYLLAALPLALLLPALWLWAISMAHPYDSTPYPAWMQWNARQLAWPTMASISYFFKYSIW
ncbi:hypothetical protein QN367_19070, partial [Cryobacterium sp. RTS3]